jgi:hypothetical protein
MVGHSLCRNSCDGEKGQNGQRFSETHVYELKEYSGVTKDGARSVIFLDDGWPAGPLAAVSMAQLAFRWKCVLNNWLAESDQQYIFFGQQQLGCPCQIG